MTAISSRLSTLCLTLLLLWRCTAQSITPTNGTSPRLPRNQTDQIGLQISRADGLSTPSMPALIPLTDGATDNLPSGGKSGNIFDANVNNVANITFMSIAWISCDPSDYTGNLGAIDVLQRAVENQAAAAVLYSKSSSYCNYTAGSKIDPKYTFLYSMSSARDSVSFNTMVHYNPDGMPERVTINLVERLTSNNGTGNGNGSDGAPSQSQPGGPSPSTAVAMIILYSITGVITALFLIIIITGAIRAHRHPERYGPRAVLGRARQSRAKGIARAMLDSIPIVKFGDNENDIPKPEDVELAAGSSSTNEHGTNGETREGVKQESTAETAERRGSDGGQIERTVSRDSEGGIGADVAPTATQPTKTSEHALACSICTEEFERGEDVRVLPCDHKFHPACIDPWLLNVSGTCPLCRIDLRPPTATDPNDPSSPSAEDANADGSNAQTSPDSVPHPGSGEPINANLQPNETSGRQSRRFSSLLLDPLNRRRMEHATPEERIEALRQYNARRQQESRRRRISARLSDAFGRRRNDESSAEGSRSGTPADAATNEVAPQAPMLSPLSFEEQARHEAHATSDSPVSPVAEEHDEITPAPQIRVQTPGGETDAPSPVETSRKD